MLFNSHKQDRIHPFFCSVKKCRKTAWDTPEYLSEYDWSLAAKICEALQNKDKNKFDSILFSKIKSPNQERNDYIFFFRIIGWPEGQRYYIAANTDFYFNMLVEKDLPKLEKALIHHNERMDTKFS